MPTGTRKRTRQEWARVQVRLRAPDEAVLRELAESEARSPANLLRHLALRHIKQRTAQQRQSRSLPTIG
jgi:hypothetical protein